MEKKNVKIVEYKQCEITSDISCYM